MVQGVPDKVHSAFQWEVTIKMQDPTKTFPNGKRDITFSSLTADANFVFSVNTVGGEVLLASDGDSLVSPVLVGGVNLRFNSSPEFMDRGVIVSLLDLMVSLSSSGISPNVQVTATKDGGGTYIIEQGQLKLETYEAGIGTPMGFAVEIIGNKVSKE